MTSRHRDAGRSKTVRHLLSVGLALSLGYTFGIFTLGGCAGAPWPSNGQLPDRVVDKLRDCGREGPAPLQPVNYDLAFFVHVTEGAEEARVDDVMLTDSTLHLPEVEKCMSDALYGMRAPLEALALRQRNLAPDSTVAWEARALFGQAQLTWLLEAAAFVVVAYATYHVVVQFARNTHRPKPRPHRRTPETDAPGEPGKGSKPEPPAAGDPKATDPPPPPPPPRKDDKETCGEKLPHLIRCDDPKISGYRFNSENAAFNEIVDKVGKGLRKEKSGDGATAGPCKDRGGFHTNVRKGKEFVASILGCDCCDESSGKALEKEKAQIRYH